MQMGNSPKMFLNSEGNVKTEAISSPKSADRLVIILRSLWVTLLSNSCFAIFNKLNPYTWKDPNKKLKRVSHSEIVSRMADCKFS